MGAARARMRAQPRRLAGPWESSQLRAKPATASSQFSPNTPRPCRLLYHEGKRREAAGLHGPPVGMPNIKLLKVGPCAV